MADWDGRADLARISARTLVIAGAATTPTDLRLIADGVANSVLHVLDPGAHLTRIEQAGKVTALLAADVRADAQRSASYAAGIRVRRAVLGDEHVDRAIATATDFTMPFQDFITRTAWGDIWSRPGLDHHTWRLLTLAVLTAVGNELELELRGPLCPILLL